jgi:hypothetical protein
MDAAPEAVQEFLRQARAAGLRVQADGDRLVIRGPKHAGALAKALLDRKAEVLPLLGEPVAGTGRWDGAEENRLLAELRAEVERVNREVFRGSPPSLFRTVAADLLAVGEGYIANREQEAARGWDVLKLLRDLKPLVAQVAARVKKG